MNPTTPDRLGRLHNHRSLLERTRQASRVFDVTVIVPVFNGGADLERLLQSLMRQKGCRLQILVLDSGSTDGSAALATRFPVEWVKLSATDFHHARTRNRGVTLAKYPLVFLVVQDASLDNEDTLYKLCVIRERRRLAALSAAEVPRPDADAYARFALHQYYRDLGMEGPSTLVHSHWRGSVRERMRAASIGNVACLYKTDLLRRYPFEGDFAEDFTWAVGRLKQGYRIGKTNEAVIVHSHTRPAHYAFRKMIASRRLMVGLEVSEPESTWAEPQVLGFLAALGARFAELSVGDEQLSAFLQQRVPQGTQPSDPEAVLARAWEDGEEWAPEEGPDRALFQLKVLAGAAGWRLGAEDIDAWTELTRGL